MRIVSLIATALTILALAGQAGAEPPDPFAQMNAQWRAPNVYRTASGAPGPEYWQQYVRYDIEATLDDDARRIEGRVEIAYENRSPDSLGYLWLQLDQNRFKADSVSQASRSDTASDELSMARLHELRSVRTGDFGYDIGAVTDARGRPLEYTIRDTMMRVELPAPLQPEDTTRLAVEYSFAVPSTEHMSNRTAYEILKSGARNYFIAMWYPRMAAYTDYDGWVVKSFLYGEPALDFADFDVEITLPETYTVAATGTLENPSQVLPEDQRERLAEAREADEPIFVIPPDEAEDRAERDADGTKTWHFTAEQVRDFAFAASPAFIWDAMGHRTRAGDVVLAQSLYPPEAMPLWNRFSTQAVAHALDIYGKMTLPYPYPHATSINAPISSGMEYPMLAANAPRPKADGTYSRRIKFGLIGVVIHEVGHNWFPMIVNSDERHWLWMDEGLNSFVDEMALRLWEEDFPFDASEPRNVTDEMTREHQRPIMTQSDAYIDRGATGYTKPAAALNILRETILGRELFDKAFQEYARRWWFKRPTPEDFFRTMEDAAGRDLDWFWRGWFYGTDHVDIALSRVTRATIDTEDPEVEAAYKREREAEEPRSITAIRNEEIERRVDKYPELLDFYNEHDEHSVTETEREKYENMLDKLQPWQEELLELGANLYFLEFTNKGGLVMPLILDIVYADGSGETRHIPAEIWRYNPEQVTKLIVTEKEIEKIVLDPHQQTADADMYDNRWPRGAENKRIELDRRAPDKNLMQEMGHEPDGG